LYWSNLFQDFGPKEPLESVSLVTLCLFVESDQSWYLCVLRVEQKKGHRSVSVNTNTPLETLFNQYLAEEVKKTGQQEEQLLISHGLSLDKCKKLLSTHFSMIQENEERIPQMKKIGELCLEKKKKAERYLLLQETALFINFDHANIVRFYGYTKGTKVPDVIMKFYSQGDLDERIHSLRAREAKLWRVVPGSHRFFVEPKANTKNLSVASSHLRAST
jgi:hypothetical protein